MADQRVRINIGSSYNGQGMNQAMNSLGNLSRDVGKAAGAVGRLGGAFSQLEGTASKSIGAVAGAVSSLATGGVIGLVIFAVTTLIQWFQKLGDESKDVEKVKKSLEEVKDAADAVVNKFNSGTTKIDKYTQSIERLATAHKRLRDAQNEVKKMQMDAEVEKMEEGPDKVAAQGDVDYKKAQMDAASTLRQANHKIAAEAARIKALSKKIAMADQTISDLKGGYDTETKQYTGLARLESIWSKEKLKLYTKAERGADEDEIKEQKERVADAKKAYDEQLARINAQIIKRNDWVQERKQVKEEKTASEAERTLIEAKVAKDLEIAERRYKGALAEATDMKEQEIAAEQELVARQNAYAYNWQAMQERQEELQKTMRELAQAQKDYTKACKRAKDAADAVEAIADGGIWNPNGAGTGGRARRRRGAAANNVDNQPFQDFAKPEGWDARWAQTHPEQAAALGIEAGMSAKDKRTYDEMNRKLQNAGALTKEDREKVLGKKRAQDWEELAAKDPEIKAALAAIKRDKQKEKVESLADKVGDIKTSISNIETTLKNLGAK